MPKPEPAENWLEFEQFTPECPELANRADSEHFQCTLPPATLSPMPPACETFEAGLGI